MAAFSELTLYSVTSVAALAAMLPPERKATVQAREREKKEDGRKAWENQKGEEEAFWSKWQGGRRSSLVLDGRR